MHGISAFWAGVNSDVLEWDELDFDWSLDPPLLGLGLGLDLPLPSLPSLDGFPFPFPSLPPLAVLAVIPEASLEGDGFLGGPFLRASWILIALASYWDS